MTLPILSYPVSLQPAFCDTLDCLVPSTLIQVEMQTRRKGLNILRVNSVGVSCAAKSRVNARDGSCGSGRGGGVLERR